MSRKLTLAASGALLAFADATPGTTSSMLARTLLRAAQVIEAARPDLSPAECELVTQSVRDLLLLRPDELPGPERLAAELHDVIGQCDLWPEGLRPGFVEWVSGWPLAAIWALIDRIEDDLVTTAALGGASTPRGRPKTQKAAIR